MKSSFGSKQAEASVQSINTTIGELIETLTGIAIETGASEEEAYVLASLALNDLFDQNKAHLAN